jgi:hypothetical protein
MPGDTQATAPALGVSIKGLVDAQREIVFQTHVEQEISDEKLNALLDKLSRAMDRQLAKATLVTLKKDLAKHQKELRQMEDDFRHIEQNARELWEKSGKRGEFKEQPKDVAAKAQAEATIKRWRSEIANLEALIGETEQKAT